MIKITKGGHEDTRIKEKKPWTKSGYMNKDGELDGKKVDYSKVMKDIAKPKYSEVK